MSEETIEQGVTEEVVEEVTEETTEEVAEKKPRKPRKASKPRKPSYKDWIRVIKSQGNGLANIEVSLHINEATGVCKLTTIAPKMEGSDEREAPRTQIFKVSEVNIVNEPEEATVEPDGNSDE